MDPPVAQYRVGHRGMQLSPAAGRGDGGVDRRAPSQGDNGSGKVVRSFVRLLVYRFINLFTFSLCLSQMSVFASLAPSQQLQCVCLVLVARSSIRACDLQRFVAHAVQTENKEEQVRKDHTSRRALRDCLDTLARLESLPPPPRRPPQPEVVRRTSAIAQREAERGSLFRLPPSKRKRESEEATEEKKAKTTGDRGRLTKTELHFIYSGFLLTHTHTHSLSPSMALQSLSPPPALPPRLLLRWPTRCVWFPITTPATLCTRPRRCSAIWIP